jgi:hypothetical protein
MLGVVRHQADFYSWDETVIPIVSKSYDEGFAAGYNAAARYAEGLQNCGHPVANIEKISLGSGEVDEYCNMCLQIRNELLNDRKLWATLFEETAKKFDEASEDVFIGAGIGLRESAKLLRSGTDPGCSCSSENDETDRQEDRLQQTIEDDAAGDDHLWGV